MIRILKRKAGGTRKKLKMLDKAFPCDESEDEEEVLGTIEL